MARTNRRRFLEAATGGVGALAAGTWPAFASQGAAPRGRGGHRRRRGRRLRWMDGAVSPRDGTHRHARGLGTGRAIPARRRAASRAGIRAVYGEREIDTKWVLQAFDRWRAREAEWGKKLFYRTGQLSLATEWTKELTETRKVFDRLAVKDEVVKPDDSARQYPQMNTRGLAVAMYTPSTGVLKAREGCVAVAQAFGRVDGSSPPKRSSEHVPAVCCRTSRSRPANASRRRRSCSHVGPGCRAPFPAVMRNKLETPRRAVFFYGHAARR